MHIKKQTHLSASIQIVHIVLAACLLILILASYHITRPIQASTATSTTAATKLESVIVEYADADIVTGSTKTEIAEEKAAIVDAAEEVDDDLEYEEGHTEKTSSYSHLPYAAYEVDAAGREALENNPRVKSVTPNAVYEPAMNVVIPSIGGTVSSGFSHNGTGTTVAILDSGVEKSHGMLAGRVVGEACFSKTGWAGGIYLSSLCPGGAQSSGAVGSGEPCNSVAISSCSHGTHVASIAAGRQMSVATSPNPTAIRGVASSTNIISVQIFSRVDDAVACGGNPPCLLTSRESQLSALNWVMSKAQSYDNAGRPIAAINMSIVGKPYVNTHASCHKDAGTAFVNAISTLRQSYRIATVVSNGNEGNIAANRNKIGIPACISDAIAVGATNRQGTAVASYSNNGTLTNLLAPGGDNVNGGMILAAQPNNRYNYMQGTSMAAPVVAGSFAVLRQKHPNATVSQLLDILQRSGVNVTDTRTGYTSNTKKRVNLAAALATPIRSPTALRYASTTVKLNGASPSRGAVKLSYSKVGSASGYQIVRAESKNGTYKHVKYGKSTSYVDNGRKFNRTYYYKVRAYINTEGTTHFTPWSAVKAVRTKLTTPSPKVRSVSSTKVKVSINKVSGAQRYKVYRSTKKTVGFKQVKLTSSRSYTDTKLKKNTTYYYKVRAMRKDGKVWVYSGSSVARQAKTGR